MSEQKVIDTLAKKGAPMKAGDIATETGLPKEDVVKVIKKLVKEEKLYSPKMCFYDVKK